MGGLTYIQYQYTRQLTAVPPITGKSTTKAEELLTETHFGISDKLLLSSSIVYLQRIHHKGEACWSRPIFRGELAAREKFEGTEPVLSIRGDFIFANEGKLIIMGDLICLDMYVCDIYLLWLLKHINNRLNCTICTICWNLTLILFQACM